MTTTMMGGRLALLADSPASTIGGDYSTHWMENGPELYSTPSLPVTNTSQLRVPGEVGQPWNVRLELSVRHSLPLLTRTQL